MKVVILGAGRRGVRLAKRLSDEKKDVVIIDRDPEKIKVAMDNADCMGCCGNGTSLEDLFDCNIAQADAFIAITGSDEVNLVSCSLVSGQFHVPLTLAVIRNMSYTGYSGQQKSLMGISYVINPNVEVAKHIYENIAKGIYSENIQFSSSLMSLFNVYIAENSQFTGLSLKEFKQQYPGDYIVAAISNNERAFVPSGDSMINAGDTLSFVSNDRLPDCFELTAARAKKIIISGLTKETDCLIRLIPAGDRRNIKVIDTDEAACEKFAQQYSNLIVLCDDITAEGVFERENIGKCDLFLALSKKDEVNIISSSYAKNRGAKKSIALVNSNPDYIRIASHMNIDSLISTQDVTVDSIMSYLNGSNVSSMHSLFGGSILTLEVKLPSSSHLCNKKLKEINMRGMAIIAGVTRNDFSVIPSGDFVLKPGDTLIIVFESGSDKFVHDLIGV